MGPCNRRTDHIPPVRTRNPVPAERHPSARPSMASPERSHCRGPPPRRSQRDRVIPRGSRGVELILFRGVPAALWAQPQGVERESPLRCAPPATPPPDHDDSARVGLVSRHQAGAESLRLRSRHVVQRVEPDLSLLSSLGPSPHPHGHGMGGVVDDPNALRSAPAQIRGVAPPRPATPGPPHRVPKRRRLLHEIHPALPAKGRDAPAVRRSRHDGAGRGVTIDRRPDR